MTPPPTLKADRLREKGGRVSVHGRRISPQPADAYGRSDSRVRFSGAATTTFPSSVVTRLD